ncbi:MAG: pyridoxal phosphate-dependent aminotransferase [Anaerolineales bacterium]|nr:pyridoxal phosphate-dependent aminotransferase [Anaerolineales bacterium]
MTAYEFDRMPERDLSHSGKWRKYAADVLPMGLADMDFVSPEPVTRALQAFVAQGMYGYPLLGDAGSDSPTLREAVVARLERLYGWRVAPEALVLLPGVVTGFNLAAHTVAQPGGEMVLQPPIYHPMLDTAAHAGLARHDATLARDADGRFGIDWDVFAGAFNANTRMFLLCNPHNPTGRVFGRDEVARMAQICLRHGVTICSDEIHAELVFDGRRHVPIATLAPEVEQQTITLIAPSKTFNLAGLQCSVAVIPNADLRAAYVKARRGLVAWVNVLGLIAGEAAYREGDEWLAQLLPYLRANRDYLAEFVRAEMQGVRMCPPEATYLAWLDCRETSLPDPCQFFLDLGRVACVDGAQFGPGGKGFVRLNFGCPRPRLAEALKRMKAALEA